MAEASASGYKQRALSGVQVPRVGGGCHHCPYQGASHLVLSEINMQRKPNGTRKKVLAVDDGVCVDRRKGWGLGGDGGQEEE